MAKYLYDLKDHAQSWSGSAKHYFPNGDVGSEAGNILPPGPPPHFFYWVLDSIMYKTPDGMNPGDTPTRLHYHVHGYETFFLDEGTMWLFINGQKCLCHPGDIIHLQAGQAHEMSWVTNCKWRGTYHDYEVYPEGREVNEVLAHLPEAKNDPELMQHYREMDNIRLEPYVTVEEVPAEKCLAVKNISRPWASYDFPGCSMKIVVERWENGGSKELCCAVMEPGFTAQWDNYPALREVLYVRSGKVKFNIMGEEVIADRECVVDIPRFAPHSLEALEHSEVYDLGGQTMWSLFLQNYTSVRELDPERFAKPETIQELKEKFNCPIKSIGMK